MTTVSAPIFREVVDTKEFISGTEIRKNKMIIRPHWGQQLVLDSTARWIMFFAGTQVGKTSIGVHWLLNEITRCGAGDYLVVTSTFPLLKKKLLQEFLAVFDGILHLGSYSAQDKIFTLSKQGEIDILGSTQQTQTRIMFGSAENPESLESATAKAAWLDELGQKQFKRDSWEAILRRLSLYQGRILGTTTLYVLGWLKTEVYDKWKAGDRTIEIIQCESIANPLFSKEEFLRARNSLPKWKFNLFYRGVYDKPAGLIYDCFDEQSHVISRKMFEERYQKTWPVFVGHDFGGVNPSALFYAQDPSTSDLYLYREYKPSGKSTDEQALDLLSFTKTERIMRAVGGNHNSDDGWREAYTKAGWRIYEPRTAKEGIEAQIDKVYGLKKQGRIYVLDECTGYIDENSTFARKLDDKYEPTDEIDAESTFHFMAAERYVISDLVRSSSAYFGDGNDGYPNQIIY